jgi:hypothetical protein
LQRSALAGTPIVSPEWIKACGEQNKAVVPSSSMFIRSLPTKTADLEKIGHGVAALAAALHLSKQNPRIKMVLPLANVSVYLCGTYSQSKRNDIQLLSKEGGAKILSSPAAAISKLKTIVKSGNNSSKVVLLCDDSSSNTMIPSALEKEARSAVETNPGILLAVKANWLFDSITCGSELHADPFEPCSSKAKELWRLSLKSKTKK